MKRFARFAAIAAVCAVLLTCGCASTIPLTADSRVPGAQGHVDVEGSEDQNTRLKVEVKHLASPERVSPESKVYVVWGLPRVGVAQNLGALRVDDDLSGKLETTTAMRDFDLFITTETRPDVQSPTGLKVLTATIEQD